MFDARGLELGEGAVGTAQGQGRGAELARVVAAREADQDVARGGDEQAPELHRGAVAVGAAGQIVEQLEARYHPRCEAQVQHGVVGDAAGEPLHLLAGDRGSVVVVLHVAERAATGGGHRGEQRLVEAVAHAHGGGDDAALVAGTSHRGEFAGLALAAAGHAIGEQQDRLGGRGYRAQPGELHRLAPALADVGAEADAQAGQVQHRLRHGRGVGRSRLHHRPRAGVEGDDAQPVPLVEQQSDLAHRLHRGGDARADHRAGAIHGEDQVYGGTLVSRRPPRRLHRHQRQPLVVPGALRGGHPATERDGDVLRGYHPWFSRSAR